MSWTIRIRCSEKERDIIHEENREIVRAVHLQDILAAYNIDMYDIDELGEDCFDCMNSATDTQYIVSVFEQGKPDPYDNLARENEKFVDEMRRMGLYYDSLEEVQRRKGDADARKDSGASCTCELVF